VVTREEQFAQDPEFIPDCEQLKGSMKELNMFHNYETEKITRKASDVAGNLQ